ncbi:MAG TPA: LytR C-terminal domain-containing protein [Solirubrobacterales bacterium]
MQLIEKIGAFAGLASFLGLAFFALLSFTQARDIRRLREWAGSAPERDAERKESTSAVAAQRAEELRQLEESRTAERDAVDLREERRQRREAGLPELTRGERARDFLSAGGRLAEPRYLVAIFIAVVLIGGGVAYAVTQGGSDGGSGGKSAAAGHGGEIEVTVLNGTAVPGLAARYGNKVERKGFKLGAVTNSSSSFVDSVVMYKPGHASEGHRVAKMLDIAKVQEMSSEISSVSAGAPVAVIVGEDNASSSS